MVEQPLEGARIEPEVIDQVQQHSRVERARTRAAQRGWYTAFSPVFPGKDEWQ